MGNSQLIPFLPPLAENNHLTNQDRHGSWLCRNVSELKILSEALQFSKGSANFCDVDSIPDIWARPILFKMALTDTNHILHEKTRGEWRGLLALLALRCWRHIPEIRIETVSTGTNNLNQQSPRFLSALSRLLPPAPSFWPKACWDPIYIILFGEKPIGMLSPLTIVCTSVDYFNSISHVPWFNQEFLQDPIPFLALEEKMALAWWLGELRRNFQRDVNMQDTDPCLNSLFHQLHQFESELGQHQHKEFSPDPSVLGIHNSPYHFLDAAIKPESRKSSVELRPSRNSPSVQSLPTLLVVDEEIPNQWNIQPHEIPIYETGTFDSLRHRKVNTDRNSAGTIHLPGNVRFFAAEHLFTEYLHVINSPDLLPGAILPESCSRLHLDGVLVTPLLPIRQEILHYLTPDDLARRIRFECSGETITVHVSLPLSGSQDQPKDFTFRKIFNSKTGIKKTRNIPVLEIWPRMNIPNWKTYYTFYSTIGRDTFEAIPLTIEGPNPIHQQQTIEYPFSVFLSESCPEAFECYCPHPDESKMRNTKVEAGLILLRPLDSAPAKPKTVSIGVDFGTTGTNIYCAEQDTSSDSQGKVRPLDFECFLEKITGSGPSERICMDELFLPTISRKVPIQSIFQLFEGNGKHELKPLLDGRIYHFLEKESTSTSSINTDLKWSNDPSTKYQTQAFLEQACLQAAAIVKSEGAQTLNWHFSYPTAFSTRQLEWYQNTCNTIISKFDEKVGACNLLPLQKESIVAARHFACEPELEGSFLDGAICIDVGGGTSDISVWQQNRLIWHCSLRMAGHRLFQRMLFQNHAAWKALGMDLDPLHHLASSRSEFFANMTSILSSKGDEILRRLPNSASSPELSALISRLGFGLGGLLHYVGMGLKVLIDAGKYDRKAPTICMAGNGSNILHWLSLGSYHPRRLAGRFLARTLAEAAGLPELSSSTRVHLSKVPKSEAARGLVSSGTRLMCDENSQTLVYAGEPFICQGLRRDWDQVLTAEQISAGIALTDGLQNLENYVNYFNRHTASKDRAFEALDLDTSIFQQISSAVTSDYMNQNGNPASDINVDPPFIAGLEKILARLEPSS